MNEKMTNLGMNRSVRFSVWRPKGIHTGFVMLLIFLSASLLEAAEDKRIAFVVGVGTYDNLSPDKQLKNAVNDAEGVSTKLTEIGFQVTKAPNLTRSAFNAKWQTVLDSLGKDDTFVLYYSGHGVQIDGHNYLLPRDIPYIEYGRDEQLKREAISLNELLADLSSGDRPHPQSSVVILDACRDNPLIPPGYKSTSTARGLAGLPESDGLFVMYAAASNRTALDRLSPSDNAKYSVFTRTLLPLIGRTDLSIQELSNDLKDQVWKLAKSVGREQRPTYYDGIVGRFCLPGCSTKAEKEPVGFKENLTTTYVRSALPKEVTDKVKEDSPPAPQSSERPQQLAMKQNAPLPQAQPTEKLPSAITGKDGAPMVLIHAGSFQMGSTQEEMDRAMKDCKRLMLDQQTCEDWDKPELPQHKVQMGAFYLDKYEVTNRLFQRFTQQTGYRTTAEREGSAWALVEGKGWKDVRWEDVKGANWQKPEAGATVFDSNRAEHPVVSVSWEDAQAYCRWAEKLLPTEAEWEYATRAGTTTKYWWGDGNPGVRRVENIADESAKTLLKNIMMGYDDGSVRTTVVGSYEANPWGLHDISGNAKEWTADWFDGDYYSKSPVANPKGPSSGKRRVLRSGSWNDVPDLVWSANRDWDLPTSRGAMVGFRCAQDVPRSQNQMTTSAEAREIRSQPTADSEKTITGKDGAPMVLIPAGEFMMGSREDMAGAKDELPAHPVYLDAYYIDQYEVTTMHYAKFVHETKRDVPEFWPTLTYKLHEKKPVIGVTWDDAVGYCAWAGKRLPTEAEWEKAARGTDQRKYPWGNEVPDRTRANFDRTMMFTVYGVLVDVGSLEAGKSPYGAYDMAGNVSEWVSDWYGQDYYMNSPPRNPKGPASGQERVIRGGFWNDHSGSWNDYGGVASVTRGSTSFRSAGNALGLRCAQDAPN